MSGLSVTFLGGLSRIGRNCMVLEYDNSCVVIDCGIMFPEADMPGIDYVLPDLNYLFERKDKIDGIVITHAHEDHAGGLQFLLREVDAPIYSSPLSLALLSNKLEEAKLLDKTNVKAVNDGDVVKIGKFEVEFIPVTHSVPYAFAASYTCKEGTVVHTGDFKIDHSPIDGRRTDLARFGEIANTKNVVLLMSDSTGAEKPGTTGSESSVKTSIERIFLEQKDKRIIVSTFASHIHRIIQIVESAIANGRKIAFLGRSLHTNIEVAKKLKLYEIAKKHLIDIEEVDNFLASKVCIIATGSQGEPLSALSLVASGQSRFISVDETDCVVFSSHTIPGNEMSVNRIINGLMRRGATVIHDGMEPIHVSGHASADELATMIALVKPEYFIPVHGEHRHMKAHCDIALRTGIDQEHVLLCHDGDSVIFEKDEVHVDHDSASGAYLYVDGNVGGITNALLRDRKQLGEDGLIVCVATIDSLDGSIMGDVEIVTRGWVPRSDAQGYLDNAANNVRKELEAALDAGERNVESLKAIVRKAVGTVTSDSTGRKPTIIPLVIEA